MADVFQAVFETAAEAKGVAVDAVYRKVFAGIGRDGDALPDIGGLKDTMFIRARADVDGRETAGSILGVDRDGYLLWEDAKGRARVDPERVE